MDDKLKQDIKTAMEPDKTQTTEVVDIPTIKVGEEEYTQDDLQRLVGLGKIGVEAEDKFGVKIDRIWPNHQRTINEKLALEQELKTIKETRDSAVPTGDGMSEAEVERLAKEQLGKLGYLPAEAVQKMVADTVQGYRLLDETQTTIDEMAEQGYPKTTVEDLLTFMNDPANPKNPEKAYKLMFEAQIDKVKEEKLGTLRGSGLVTTPASTAGSKVPAPQKITKDNLQDALKAALGGQ